MATFIKTYTSELPGPARESVASYNLARLLHAQEAHAPALKALTTVDTKEPFIILAVKSLEAKIFAELQEWDAATAVLLRLNSYIQSRNDLGTRGEACQLFLYFFAHLQRLQPRNEEAKIALQLEIESAPVFAEKKWLLRQLKWKWSELKLAL